MMGHYRSNDGKTWYFACKEKELARSMSFDGEEGYFLTVEEYEDFQEREEENEEIEALQIENANLREIISEAFNQAHSLKYLLGNA